MSQESTNQMNPVLTVVVTIAVAVGVIMLTSWAIIALLGD